MGAEYVSEAYSWIVRRVSERGDVQRIADEEQRTIAQVCEMLLHEGVETYKKEGPKFMQRLVAKQKARLRTPLRERGAQSV